MLLTGVPTVLLNDTSAVPASHVSTDLTSHQKSLAMSVQQGTQAISQLVSIFNDLAKSFAYSF